MNKQKTKRIESLDAFRGIASILIMITHLILVVPEVCRVENLGYIYNAFSWKLPYFFILSGYVLTLSYQRIKDRVKHPYRTFIVNRFLRIYPLFFLSTVAMFLIKIAFDAGADLEGASMFYNISWRIEGSFNELLHALSLIGCANSWTFNSTAWTLVFEMRYAILFPLFVWIMRKSLAFFLVFIALSIIAINIDSGIERVDFFYAQDLKLSNLCSMFNFLVYYIAGIAFALNRDSLTKCYLSLSSVGSAIYLAIVIILAIIPVWETWLMPQGLPIIVKNISIMLGILMWMVVLINNERIKTFFSNPILTAIGRSSFSIYMWHIPIFTLLYMSLRDSMNIWWIIAISSVTTILFAQFSFKYIEQRFMLNKK